MDELTRRNVRYICFRLKTEEEGGEKAKGDGIMEYAKKIKTHMEEQTDFGGWLKFGVTWDVDEKAHLVVVLLKRSLDSKWNAEVKKNAIDLPNVKKVKKWLQK